jgi:rubredoxin
MHKFTCEACGGEFESDATEHQLKREEAAFSDVPDAPMAEVCDQCWWGMRKAFPSLDARLKLEGL